MELLTEKIIKFGDIIGHEKITAYLIKSLKNHKLAHAYLFLGQPNLGKRTLALNFIQSILCHSQPSQNGNIPCQICSLCRQFLTGQYSDYYEINKESDKKYISIEQIRDLRHKLSLKSNSYKFALISEAENLTTEASNSFLKTLEEPTAKTLIFIISSNEESVPKTIISRCQIIRFNTVPFATISQSLRQKYEISPSSANQIVQLSQGRPGLALKLAESPDFFRQQEEKTKETISLINSSLSQKLNYLAAQKFSSQDSPAAFSDIFSLWQTVGRDLLLTKFSLENNLINRKEKLSYKKSAAGRKIGQLCEFLNFSLLVSKLLKNNINPKVLAENFLTKF